MDTNAKINLHRTSQWSEVGEVLLSSAGLTHCSVCEYTEFTCTENDQAQEIWGGNLHRGMAFLKPHKWIMVMF